MVLSACSFADGNLLDAMPELLSMGARVLVVCTATATEAVSALLFAGASGCLSVDDCAPSDVVAATRTVVAGHAALHPVAAAAVLQQWRMMRSSPGGLLSRSQPPTLTRREVDVLHALARGLPTKTIARELSLSPKTVEAHISRLLTKLGARNRAQAISVARSQGLFEG
jgi:DNA-binding NarL/FixJ family response regulator